MYCEGSYKVETSHPVGTGSGGYLLYLNIRTQLILRGGDTGNTQRVYILGGNETIHIFRNGRIICITLLRMVDPLWKGKGGNLN